jgi:hypothetical protein
MNLDSKGGYLAARILGGIVVIVVVAALVYALIKGLDYIHIIGEQN